MMWPLIAGLSLACVFLSYWLLAYAIARLLWRKRGILLVLFAIFVSAQVWWIPQLFTSVILRRDTWWVGHCFADWLVTAFGIVFFLVLFRDVPRDQLDAARLDGIGGFGMGWHIILPMAKSALFLLVLLYLLATFVDYPWVVRPHGYYGIITGLPPLSWDIISPEVMSALKASIFSTVPLFAIFFLARKFLSASRSARFP